MTSLETILSNFYFDEIEKPGSKYPKFGKAGRKDYIFTCKHCSSQSEPMDFHRNIAYRLTSHLTRYCHPSSSSELEQQDQEEEQGPE